MMNLSLPAHNTLQEPVALLCEEVGLPPPAPDPQGVYVIDIDGQELRISLLNNGKVIICGIIGRADEIAARRQQSRQTLLTHVLHLQAVRFGKLGTAEVMTLEPATDELLLWTSLVGPEVSIPAFLQSTESLLNELEFWKNWLANA